MEFEDAMRSHLESLPKPGRREKRLKALLDSEDSPRRRRVLKRLESAARREVGVDGMQSIDWSKIDWASIFQTILKLLMTLFAL